MYRRNGHPAIAQADEKIGWCPNKWRGPFVWLALVLLALVLGGWRVVAAGASHDGPSVPRQPTPSDLSSPSGLLSSPSASFGFVPSVVAVPVAAAAPAVTEDTHVASPAATEDAPAATPPVHSSSSPGGDWVLAPDVLPVPAASGDLPPLPVAHSAQYPGFHPVRVLRTEVGAETVTLTCWNPATGRTERIVGRRGRDTVFALADPASLHLPTRAVQDVRTGDLVASRDPKTGRSGYGRVVGTRTRMAPVLVTVGLRDKATGHTEALTCTPEHPLYVRDKGWVAAGALAQGSQIVTRAGPALTVSGLGWTRAGENTGQTGSSSAVGGTRVYNFEVAGTHDYFVGDTGGGVLAHNEPCMLNSKIGKSSYATRLADRIRGAAQDDVDKLTAALTAGNRNPGIGTRALGAGFLELRGANLGRVIVKQTGDNAYDIVGKFTGHARGDAENSATIERLIEGYEP